MAKPKVTRSKNEALSLRVDPKLRYRLDLISRIEERTLTSVIERMSLNYAREEVSSKLPVWLEPLAIKYADMIKDDPHFQLYSIEAIMWIDDEPLRTLRFLVSYPDILNARERVLLTGLSSSAFYGKETLWIKTEVELKLGLPLDNLKPNSVFFKTFNLSKIRKNWTLINQLTDEVVETGLYKGFGAGKFID